MKNIWSHPIKLWLITRCFPFGAIFTNSPLSPEVLLAVLVLSCIFPLYIYTYIYKYDVKIDQVNVCFWPPKLMLHDMIAWMNSQEDVMLLGKYWQKWSQLVTPKDPNKYSIFTYMNGWSLWQMFVYIYTIHGSYGTYDFVGRWRKVNIPVPWITVSYDMLGSPALLPNAQTPAVLSVQARYCPTPVPEA